MCVYVRSLLTVKNISALKKKKKSLFPIYIQMSLNLCTLGPGAIINVSVLWPQAGDFLLRLIEIMPAAECCGRVAPPLIGEDLTPGPPTHGTVWMQHVEVCKGKK